MFVDSVKNLLIVYYLENALKVPTTAIDEMLVSNLDCNFYSDLVTITILTP